MEPHEPFDSRRRAMEAVLGPADDLIQHPVVPFYLGGFADVLTFSRKIRGVIYATCDLTGHDVGQIPNSLGGYELMICTRERADWAPGLISRLARFTTEARLDVGHTMGFPPWFDDATIRAMVFGAPGASSFSLNGVRCGLLLVTGITAPELDFARSAGGAQLLDRLKRAGVLPYTDLRRPPPPGHPLLPLLH